MTDLFYLTLDIIQLSGSKLVARGVAILEKVMDIEESFLFLGQRFVSFFEDFLLELILPGALAVGWPVFLFFLWLLRTRYTAPVPVPQGGNAVESTGSHQKGVE